MRFFTDTKGIRRRPNRPHGTLPEDSLVEAMKENAAEYADRLSKHPEVLGVTLGGGLSRGYGDELSEVDLNVYLEEASLNDWLMGRGPVPHGDHLGDRYHMDVSFLSLEKERMEEWSLLKKWDASYQKVLYDPEGRVEALLDSKDVFTAEEKRRVALRGYLDCVYYGDIVVRQWTLRRDPLAANQLLGKGVPALANLLFLANDEYPPFEKWLVNYSRSLRWKPRDWVSRIWDITLTRGVSFMEAERRGAEFMKLYHEVWARIVGEEYRMTGLMELEALETLEYVIAERPTVREFTERHGESQLGYEVLYRLADIVEEDGEQVVVFNRERFLEEKAAGFPGFLGWNREMLGHVRLPR